ncbi:lipopolysaccharide assembly protein A [Azospirillaceae bacterium]
MRVVWFIAAFIALLFVSQNLESVEISLVVGRPVELPLALVIGIAFISGFFLGIAMLMQRKLRRKPKKEDSDMDEFAE